MMCEMPYLKDVPRLAEFGRERHRADDACCAERAERKERRQEDEDEALSGVIMAHEVKIPHNDMVKMEVKAGGARRLLLYRCHREGGFVRANKARLHLVTCRNNHLSHY